MLFSPLTEVTATVKPPAAARLAAGDFDSLNDLPKGIPIHTFPVEKDDTDTMLAIKYGLKEGYRTFHLYGGTGGRPDHTLANLQALGFLAQAGATGYLYGKSYLFTALRNGSLTLPARKEGIFSLFCLGRRLRGFRFTAPNTLWTVSPSLLSFPSV